MSSRNPFEEVEQFFDRMSRQFEAGEWPTGMTTGPSVDVADRAGEYVVSVDLPGYDTDDVDLRLSDRTLHVHADRETETTAEGETYIRRERREESVSRAVELPEPVEEDGIEARLRNGVLTVTLPKRTAGETESHIDIE